MLACLLSYLFIFYFGAALVGLFFFLNKSDSDQNCNFYLLNNFYLGSSSSSKSLVDLNREYRLVDMQKFGNFFSNTIFAPIRVLLLLHVEPVSCPI